MQLPAIQARRIYTRFSLGMTVAEIAQLEGTDRRRVWESIRRGLKKLAYLLDANKQYECRLTAKIKPMEETVLPPLVYLSSESVSTNTC